MNKLTQVQYGVIDTTTKELVTDGDGSRGLPVLANGDDRYALADLEDMAASDPNYELVKVLAEFTPMPEGSEVYSCSSCGRKEVFLKAPVTSCVCCGYDFKPFDVE